MIKIDHNGFLAMRLPSILLGTVTIGIFYTILRRWFSVFISVITTIMLATNSFFIASVRYASPEISILMAVLLMGYGMWLNTRPSSKLALAIGIAVSILSLYTPGLIWLFILFVIWQKKNIIELFHIARPYLLLSIFIILLLLTPLILSLLSNPDNILAYLGFPSQIKDSLVELPANLIGIPYQLFWQGREAAQFNIIGTPIFDIFILFMFLLGCYYFVIENKKKLSIFVIVGILLMLTFIALNDSKFLVLLLPLTYIAVASGINEMLNKWYVKFPHNPIAKGLAYSLVIVAVASSCFYNLNKYFIAWPQTPQTKKIFRLPPSPKKETVVPK
jgi:4-amino-4-deoxy-L-arabinose transferase-like glycosyltransferase